MLIKPTGFRHRNIVEGVTALNESLRRAFNFHRNRDAWEAAELSAVKGSGDIVIQPVVKPLLYQFQPG